MRYKLLPVDNIVPIVAVAAGERPWPAFCGAIRQEFGTCIGAWVEQTVETAYGRTGLPA